MKKVILIFIIIAFAISPILAETTYSDVGSPKGGEVSEININFAYDPNAMQRYTFGFTENTNLDWYGDNGNLSNSVLKLNSQVMQGNGDKARGKGSINFYWVLRTNKDVTAKLYLKSAMMDVNSNEMLDWYLSFDSSINNVVSHDVVLGAPYGMDHAVPIFSKSADSELNVMIGYVPVDVFTDYTPVKMEDQKFTGSVGILVETN